jgi:hypothetical protein
MSLGTWDPATEQSKNEFAIDRKSLDRFSDYAQTNQLENLPNLLDSTEQQTMVAYMQLTKEDWSAAAKEMNDQQIENLMRFFTVAENLPGWEAGAKSPVIWLGKVIKERGVGISRELQIWIKKNSTNHYLPHGALM